jgi:hypothetical protein
MKFLFSSLVSEAFNRFTLKARFFCQVLLCQFEHGNATEVSIILEVFKLRVVVDGSSFSFNEDTVSTEITTVSLNLVFKAVVEHGGSTINNLLDIRHNAIRHGI